MKPAISVIICTHNPRRDYLDRVLKALETQTLPIDVWELLLIDNASKQILSLEIDLSWHPQARHIREDQLGLTPARLRGIQEANAETLIFVDDDNVLDADYLEIALQISKDYPFLGVWGGQSTGGFEEAPPKWAEKYLYIIGVRQVKFTSWSNFPHPNDSVPFGAGFCVRKKVALAYAQKINQDSGRLKLGRVGNLLTSCEDTDIALTACDIGLGTGVFTSLNFVHLIPSVRTTKPYLLNLVESSHYSMSLLLLARGLKTYDDIESQSRFSPGMIYHLLRASFHEREFYLAARRGRRRALQEFVQKTM